MKPSGLGDFIIRAWINNINNAVSDFNDIEHLNRANLKLGDSEICDYIYLCDVLEEVLYWRNKADEDFRNQRYKKSNGA